MGIESAKAFLERMKNDEDFRKAVVECKDADSRKRLAQENGFEFALEEINEVKDELSDDELDFAGGSFWGEIDCFISTGTGILGEK